jgi:hypothetical protein
MYNLMTCSGWPGGMSFFGDCTMAWFSFVIIVFLAMIARRQCVDGVLAGTGFNIWGAFGLGIGANVLITALTGSARWSMLAGVLGVIVGGYVLGLIFDTSGGGEQY